LRRFIDAAAVVLCETAMLVFFLEARGLLGSVNLYHLATWARQSSPEAALTALVRLLGTCVSGWLLISTAVYGLGVVTGRRRLVERSRLITPSVVRRILDTLAAASVAASSIGSSAVGAGASPVPHVVASAEPFAGPHAPRRAPPPAAASSVPAEVSAGAVGRHFPHPGEAAHGHPAAASTAPANDGAASPGNGFAGLAPGTKVVVVVPGDCLSVLAQRHLGDWRLDGEIEALNYGRPQADGRALVDDHWIYPGWVLVMPANASGATVVGGTGTVVAATGGPRTAAGVSSGRRPAPAKLTTAASASKVAAPTVASPRHEPAPGPPTPLPPTPLPPTPLPPTPLPPARQPVAPPEPEPPTAVTTANGRHPELSKGHEDVGAVLAIGAVAAAGALWRLDGMRRELRHDRPRGWVIARNRGAVEAAERRARAIAGVEAMRWADLAVRYLSGLIEQFCSQEHDAVPSLVFVKVGAAGLEIVLSPAPGGCLGWFSPSADEAHLVLDSDIDLEDLEILAAGHWSAWPAVVSLGNSGDGTVLMNLEHAGSLSVEGDNQAVHGALASILLQLASQPWSQEMLAGLYSVGEPVLDDRLAPVQRVAIDRAIELAEKLDRIADAREELAGNLALSALRAMACEALPHVVVAFAGTPDGARRCLAEAALPERSGVVLAAAGPVTGARWRLVVEGGDGLLEGEVAGRSMSWKLKTGWDLEEVVLVAEALGTAGDGGGAWVSASPGQSVVPDEGREPPIERGDVEILVLGPVDVAGGEMGSVEPSRRMAALGLLAYMAAHDRPVSADQLAGSLWPLDATKDNLTGPQHKTVMNVISRARAVLGYSAGGHERLVHTPQGYRLAKDVSSDWTRFERLVAGARSQAPPEAMAGLRRALELVRGEPFSGALSSQFFEWVASEHLDLTLSAKIVDVAQDLGELALVAEDYETVTWAVEKGLLLEPTREEMFRLWMHALGRMGRAGSVDDVYRRLKLVLRQRIHPLQEPQAESYRVWRTYTAGELARTPG
jgi:DNA-binding SARP family transcriptional activator